MNKIIKQFLVLILIICTQVNITVFASVSEETPSITTLRALEILKTVGVMDESDVLDDDEWITRAQAAHFVASLSGISGVGVNDGSVYTDINAKTEFSGDIIALTQLGVFSGFGDGTFRPNDDIATGQMIKVILAATGYTIAAEADGGYLTGYIKYASRIGLLVGVDCAMDEPLIFSDAVTLLYNALEIEVMSSDSYSSTGDITVSTTKGKTVLTQLLRVGKGEGVVTSTEFSSITSSEGCLKGYIQIDGVNYLEGDSNASELLGHNIEFYYKENSSGNNIVIYAYALDADNTLIIKADDFESYTDTSFEYYDNNGKEKIARVSKFTNIVYNNRPATLSSDFALSNGTIELIDNNIDGTYDVAFVKEYRNIYTNHIDYNNGVIYDVYDKKNPLSFNISDIDETVVIYNRKGNKVTLSSIKPNSLLCCLVSIDEKCIEIYEVVNEIIGKVEAKKTTNGVSQVVIDGVSYDIADELLKNGVEWLVGDKIICYLDVNGKIAVVSDKKISRYRWAILEDVSIKGGIESEISIKLFDEGSNEGQLSIFNVADKVNINGENHVKSQIAKESRESVLNKFGGSRNLIMYARNADDEINYILTENSKEIHRYSDYSTYFVNRNTNVLGSSVGFNGNTLLFSVPTKNTSDEYYRVANATSVLSHHTEYSLKVYKLSANSLDADVLLARTSGISSPSRSSPTLLIDEVVTAINSDGNKVQKVYGYSGSAYVSYETAAENTMSQMTAFGGSTSEKFTAKRGDMVIFARDTKGRLCSAKLLCRGSEDGGKIYSTTNPSNSNYNYSQRLIFGGVYKKDGLAFQLTTIDDFSTVTESNLEIYKIASGTIIYVYDPRVGSKEDVVRMGTVNELVDYMTDAKRYSKVAVYTDTGKINAMMIIKQQYS